MRLDASVSALSLCSALPSPFGLPRKALGNQFTIFFYLIVAAHKTSSLEIATWKLVLSRKSIKA
jgi:hypothetical protein